MVDVSTRPSPSESPSLVLLGKAQSKSEHIAGVPLRPGLAKELHQVYLAKGILGTTAIEGNTLSEDEMRARIEGRLELPPSKAYLGQEVDNIALACNEILNRLARDESTELRVKDIREYNRLVLANLTLEEGVIPGQIRHHSVGVADYRAAPPEDCALLLSRLCDWLNSETFQAQERWRFAAPVSSPAGMPDSDKK